MLLPYKRVECDGGGGVDRGGGVELTPDDPCMRTIIFGN